MEYKVVRGIYLVGGFRKPEEEFEAEVNKLLCAGWKPQGGISVSLSTSDELGKQYLSMAQAMVK